MTETVLPLAREPLAAEYGDQASSRTASAVSWAAIFAGAAGAASLSLILLVLGAGLGFSTVSPWAGRGADAASIGTGAIVWIAFVAVVASGTGGYLAGRLRVKWAATHADEVYFRDTAHGFLSWSIATLVTAALLTSTIGAILGTGVDAAGTAVKGAAGGGVSALDNAAPMPGMADAGYFSDALFRPLPANAGASAPAVTAPVAPDSSGAANADAAKVFSRALRTGTMAPDDASYLGQLVAQRTGMSQEDATKRVNDVFAKAREAVDDAKAKAKEAAEKARKTAAYGSLWLFVSLLLGAFTASFAATIGGRRRDL